MKEIGVDPVAPDRRSSDYLAKFVEAEIAKWAGPVKASGWRRIKASEARDRRL